MFTTAELETIILAYAIDPSRNDITKLPPPEIDKIRLLLLQRPKLWVVFVLGILEARIYKLEEVQELIIEATVKTLMNKYEVPRLIINVPPSIGKTSITVWGILSWMYVIAKNPKNLHISRSDDLIKDNSNKIRTILESDQIRFLYGVKFRKETNAKGLWELESGGAFKASSTFGQITGFRAGRLSKDINGGLFIDDPTKPQDMHSEATLQAANAQWEDTISSRRASLDKTPVIVIMQRIGDGDFTDHLLSGDERWMHLVIPIYWTHDWIYSGDGIQIPYQLKNEGSIFKSRISDEKAISLMLNTQYSQTSTPTIGEVFDDAWILTYHTLPAIKEFHIKADTASKTNKWNDYTVFSLFGKGFDNKAYHIDMVRDKFRASNMYEHFTMFLMKCLKFINEYNPNFSFNATIHDRNKKKSQNCKIKIAIEDKDSGVGLIQTIEDNIKDDIFRDISLEKIQRREGKYSRASRCSEKLQKGQYLVNPKMSELGELRLEFRSFKANDSHRHDDMIDTVFDMMNYEIPNTNGNPLLNAILGGNQ